MKLSVCMATYKGAPYIKEQLDSILRQLGPNDEVVISDDCSPDATLEIVEAYADPRIRIFRNATNLGYSLNFENALTQATGDIVFVADQDDVWLPGKVATMVDALGEHDLVVSDVRIVDGTLQAIHPSHFERYDVRPGFWPNFIATRYIGAAMAMRRAVLEVALPLPRRTSLCAYDYWLAIVAELYFNVGLIEDPLMLYRRHELTASTGGAASVYSMWHRLLVRAYCLAHLVARLRWRAQRH